MPVPAWGKGKHIYICIHDDAVVTGRGMEYSFPPVEGIVMIEQGRIDDIDQGRIADRTRENRP
jgi:hypothetical protein